MKVKYQTFVLNSKAGRLFSLNLTYAGALKMILNFETFHTLFYQRKLKWIKIIGTFKFGLFKIRSLALILKNVRCTFEKRVVKIQVPNDLNWNWIEM